MDNLDLVVLKWIIFMAILFKKIKNDSLDTIYILDLDFICIKFFYKNIDFKKKKSNLNHTNQILRSRFLSFPC